MLVFRDVSPRWVSGQCSGQNPDLNASDEYIWKLPATPSSLCFHDRIIKTEPISLRAQSSPLSPSDQSSSSSPSPVLGGRSAFRAGRQRKDPHHVSRPRNAFIVFRCAYVKWLRNARLEEDDPFFKLYNKSPQAPPNQNDLSKIAAKVWNMMTAQEKRPFCVEALNERMRHRIQYPDFVYAAHDVGSKKQKTRKGKGRRAKSPIVSFPQRDFAPLYDIPILELPRQVGDVNDGADVVTHHFSPDTPSYSGFVNGSHGCRDDDQDSTLPAALKLDDGWLESQYTSSAEVPSEYTANMLCEDALNLNFDYPALAFPVASYPHGESSFGHPTFSQGETINTDPFFDFNAFCI